MAEKEACRRRKPATDEGLPRTEACHGQGRAAARGLPRPDAGREQPLAAASRPHDNLPARASSPQRAEAGRRLTFAAARQSPQTVIHRGQRPAAAGCTLRPGARSGGQTATIERIVTYCHGSRAKENLVLRTYLDMFYG
jgi:hypothetical protein